MRLSAAAELRPERQIGLSVWRCQVDSPTVNPRVAFQGVRR